MGPRPAWIATCALAVLGAFFLTLRLAWLAKLDGDWLPYVAHVIGATFAGGAIARQGPLRSYLESFLGGIIAIGLLALVAYTLPSAFGWIAMRSSQPWLVAAGIAIASGAAATGGAWLARGNTDAPGIASALMISTTTAACTIMLGGRVGLALGVPAEEFAVMIVASVAAFVAAYATQSVVPTKRVVACASGILILLALQLLELAMKGGSGFDRQIFLLALPFGAALLGARAAIAPAV